MRNLSLTPSHRFEFSGNVEQTALILGDVDNDNDYELVIANISGTLAIFKGINSSKAFRIASNLGSISCITVADVLNIGKNLIVCITLEGSCHLFEIINESPNKGSSTILKTNNAESEPIIEHPAFTQLVPANITRVLVADTDGDGLNELVVARTDRVLHIYRFIIDESSDTDKIILAEIGKWSLPGQCGSLTIGRDPIKGTPQLLVAQPGGTFLIINSSNEMLDNPLLSSASPSSISSLGAQTEIINLSDSSFAQITTGSRPHQLTSLKSLRTGPTNPNNATKGVGGSKSAMIPAASSRSFSTFPVLARHFSVTPPQSPLSDIMKANNANQTSFPQTSSENIHHDSNNNNTNTGNNNPGNRTSLETDLYAIISVDGTIKVQGINNKMWELQVDHQLFSLSVLELGSKSNYNYGYNFNYNNNSGTLKYKELVACSWDGLTYIVDKDQNVVRFQFPGSVCAFTAGKFAAQPGMNEPSLIYFDYNDKITVYSDLDINAIPMTNLINVLSKDPKFPQLLELIGENPNSIKERGGYEKLLKLISHLLYNTQSLDSLSTLLYSSKD